MEQQLKIFTWTRKNMMALLSSVTPDQAAFIPEGFNNNLLWNAGHVVWAQQYLVYHLAGLPTYLPDGFEQSYATTTYPSPAENGRSEIALVLQLLEETVEKTMKDFQAGKFARFTPFQGNYDTIAYHFTDWEQSLEYNNIHEARHYGFMLGMKHCLSKYKSDV